MESFNFMGLSRELRDRIYKYCLVVPGNIVHYPEYYSHDKLNDYNDRKLTGFLSLLYVSKQIHDEAAPIFYGKNTFRVTATAMDLEDGVILDKSVNWSYKDSEWWDEPFETDTVWVRKGHLIRHAAVYYHQQDVDPQQAILRTKETHENQLLGGAARLDRLHKVSCDAMRDVFRFKGDALSHLRNLATLDVDIDCLYCPMGCCRLVAERCLWPVLTRSLDSLPLNLEIRIHGVRGKAEDENAKKWRRAMPEAMKKYKAERVKEAKADLEEAEADLEKAQADLKKAQGDIWWAKDKWEEAKAKMEETMKSNG